MTAYTILASLGRSPGAITGFYYALTEEYPDLNIEKLCLLRTDSLDVRRAYEEVKSKIESQVQLIDCPIIASDLLAGEAPGFQHLVSEQIELERAAGHQIILGITGGRTSMGAMMAMSGHLYEEVTHIYHLWVSAILEKNGDIDGLSKLKSINKDLYHRVFRPNRTERQLVALPILPIRKQLIQMREAVYDRPTLTANGQANLREMDDILSLLPRRFTVKQAQDFLKILQALQSGQPLDENALLDVMGRAGIVCFKAILEKLQDYEGRNGGADLLVSRWIDEIEYEKLYWASGLRQTWETYRDDLSAGATITATGLALLALYFQIISIRGI